MTERAPCFRCGEVAELDDDGHCFDDSETVIYVYPPNLIAKSKRDAEVE